MGLSCSSPSLFYPRQRVPDLARLSLSLFYPQSLLPLSLSRVFAVVSAMSLLFLFQRLFSLLVRVPRHSTLPRRLLTLQRARTHTHVVARNITYTQGTCRRARPRVRTRYRRAARSRASTNDRCIYLFSRFQSRIAKSSGERFKTNLRGV